MDCNPETDSRLYATVYLTVNPDNRTDGVRIVARPYDREDFRGFIDDALDSTPHGQTRSDNWVFAYAFPDRRELPPLAPGADHSDYFKVLRVLAKEKGIRPSGVISLRDAFVCRAWGLDPFSAEGQHGLLTQAPGYKSLSTHFGIYKDEGKPFPTCRAVDTGFGVLLYDMAIGPGRDAYRSLMQHCADNFFNGGLCVERLCFHDLHPFLDHNLLMEHMGALNFNFDHHRRDFSFGDLKKIPLLDKDILTEGLFIKEYDMSPIAENYSQFVMGEDVRLYGGNPNIDIALLDRISHTGYPTEPLGEDWFGVSNYTKWFKDLAQEIVRCEDPLRMEELQQQVRERAQGLLERDFPDRRTDGRSQQELTQYLDIPSECFRQGPKM